MATEKNAKYCPECGHHLNNDIEQPIKKKRSSWFKIFFFLIIVASVIGVLLALASEDISEPVEAQLKTLRHERITEAYYLYTSKGFQEATTLDRFREFVKNYPVFIDNDSMQILNSKKENHQGSVDVVLTSNHGDKVQIEYQLIKENDRWKILNIKLKNPESPSHLHNDEQVAIANQPPKRQEKDKPLSFDFSVGTQVNANGTIANPNNIFKDRHATLYVNLAIANVVTGTKIEVLLQHLDSGESMAPMSTVIDRNGTIVLSSTLAPEKEGWPQGKYRLNARSSTGMEAYMDFIME